MVNGELLVVSCCVKYLWVYFEHLCDIAIPQRNTELSLSFTKKNELSKKIIGCAIEVHRHLCPDLFRIGLSGMFIL